MNNLQKAGLRFYPSISCLRMMSGEAGSGAGKGGGGGGAIRSAGGSFGKMEVAHEEEFFYKQRQDQLKALKTNQINQAKFHEDSIKHHKEAIERHEKNLQDLKK